jgi:hypothetical protein
MLTPLALRGAFHLKSAEDEEEDPTAFDDLVQKTVDEEIRELEKRGSPNAI